LLLTDAISDIKLETENDDDDENPPNYLTEQNIYHPRVALRNAIVEWLPDFFEEKQAFGPIVKPHPQSAIVLPILPPIIPSINTCMTLTLTTPTTSGSSMAMMIPEVNTAQLHALADICSAVTGTSIEPVKTNVMNSLVSATKVITTDVCSTPIIASSISIPSKVPISCVPIPINISEVMEVEKTPTDGVSNEEPMDCCTPKHLSDSSSLNSDVPIANEPQSKEDENLKSHESSTENEVDVENEVKNEKSQLSDDVVMTETTSLNSMQVEIFPSEDENLKITFDDILLFCDLFYLPFEHGKQGVLLLNEFHWLKINANVLSKNKKNDKCPEVQEWMKRSEKLLRLGDSIFKLTRKLASCVNRELCHDLFTYAWEISSVVSIYVAYVKWLALGKFPDNSNTFTQGSYTWFSKGWKETFMSGDQEPWVSEKSTIVECEV
jgi:protein O-GlcNAcase / histone acetyltransferase